MAFEQRDNSGSLFPNEDKKKEGANPNWADFKGQGIVAGVPVWIAGWKKKDRNNHTFLSISFKPKEEKAAQPPARRPPPPPPADDFGDGPDW